SYFHSERPILFMYGENDQLCYREFKELAPDVPAEDVIVIPNGTHTFSTISQQEQAIESTCSWLQRFIIDSRERISPVYSCR
ncbi:MAG: hypothetical protein O7G31_00660, partial [Calditrichaeota bacterium]|nr:hypothetical protein [Calditrichota bacterium]